jgi:hypothetical protein
MIRKLLVIIRIRADHALAGQRSIPKLVDSPYSLLSAYWSLSNSSSSSNIYYLLKGKDIPVQAMEAHRVARG